MSALADTAAELCALLADERRAIAALDHARLETIAPAKLALAERLGALRPADSRDPDDHAWLARVRAEAHATALLAVTAADAVRVLLGYDTRGYDRRAQPTTSGSTRVLAAL